MEKMCDTDGACFFPIANSTLPQEIARRLTENLQIISTGNCSFDQGLCQWRNDQNDDFDWQLIEGATPSDETGPTAGYKGVGMFEFL